MIQGFQQHKPITERCDLQSPGHIQTIPPNQTFYVIRDGKAKGKYHSARCYEAARRQMEAYEKQQQLEQEVIDEL